MSKTKNHIIWCKRRMYRYCVFHSKWFGGLTSEQNKSLSLLRASSFTKSFPRAGVHTHGKTVGSSDGQFECRKAETACLASSTAVSKSSFRIIRSNVGA